MKKTSGEDSGYLKWPDFLQGTLIKRYKRFKADVSLIQRTDANRFRPADHIDPDYGKALRKAHKKGLEILAYDVHIDRKGIRLNRRLPVDV